MSKKTNAAILIIGNEILSGRTQDTNTSTLSLWLNSLGVSVHEVRVIADIEEKIVSSIKSSTLNCSGLLEKKRCCLSIFPTNDLREFLIIFLR